MANRQNRKCIPTESDRSGKSEQSEHHTHPQSPTGDKQGIYGMTSTQPCPDKQGDTYNDKGGIPRKWEIGIGAFLAVVNFIALFIYGYQLGEMRKATKAATDSITLTREISRVDQRAWMALHSINTTPSIPEAEKELQIKVTIKNSGKTLAKKFRAVTTLEGFPRNTQGRPNFDLEENELGEDDRKSSAIVPPNGEYSGFLKAKNGEKLTQDEVDKIKSGDSLLFIHGRVEYEDIFGCPHWTTFCYRLSPSLTVFNAHEKYNNADDGPCP